MGNSGVGKSSIVAAGVLGALRSQQWPSADQPWPDDLADSRTWLVITLKPGETPAKELARAFAATWIEDPANCEAQALRWLENFRNGSTLGDLVRAARREVAARSGDSAPGCIILNIDQGEELYTRASSEDARLFARLIAQGTAVPDLLMIASLRADYYGDLQKDADLFPISTRIDVPPLTAAETEDVIRKPAQQLGAEFATPEIIPELAEATVASPGGMPLLSFMLTGAWEQMRTDDASDGKLHFPANPLDIAHPLIERAETFLRKNPSTEEALRRLFTLRLAHVPKIGEAVRRRAKKDDCQADEWRIATELAGEAWRLLTTSERDGTPMAEVAHETLLRSWPRLTQWLEAEREFLAWKGTLEAARQDHIANPGDGTLLMGTPLEKARDWLTSHRDVLSAEDRIFIEKSLESEDKRQQQIKAREADLAETRERALELSQRARNRLQWLVRGAIAAVILVGEAAIFAGWQWNRAENNLELAERQTLIAEANLKIAGEQTAKAEASLKIANEQTAIANDNLRVADEQTAKAEAALTKARIEIERRQIEWARYAAQKARDFLEQNRPDWALAMAVSAFPVDAADRWTEIARHSEVARHLEKAWPKAMLLRTLRGHQGMVRSAAFSPDGTRIVTASFDKTARIWDAATGDIILTFHGHENLVSSAAFSPDGTRIVTASSDRTARIWDAATGDIILTFHGHEEAVKSASFSPDGSRVLTSSLDGTARIWDSETGTEIIGIHVRVDSAAFSPDGTRIITTSGNNTALVWDTETGQGILALHGHEDIVRSAAFSPDSTRIVTSSEDSTTRIWDAETGTETHKVYVLSKNAAFSPEGNRIVISTDHAAAHIWHPFSNVFERALRGHQSSVDSATFSPDGTRIVTASSDGTAMIWIANRGLEIPIHRGHLDAVNSAAFSPDGTKLVTASNDKTAQIWYTDLKNEDRSPALRGHERAVNSAAFSPDGTRVVTASDDKTARIWDANNGEALHTLRGHEGLVLSANFSADGKRIVTTSSDWTARIWDAESGEEITSLNGHVRPVLSAAFSPDGTRIVTASSDNTARIWSSAKAEEIQILRGHKSFLKSAKFSPDGTRVVTASSDRTVSIWNVETGEQIRVLYGHTEDVNSANFSPDGSRILTASDDKTARVWDFTPLKDIVDLTRARVDEAEVFSLEQRCALYLIVEGCP